MFEGKAVLVTGAGGGIGKDVAREFLRRGASVIGSDLPGHSAELAADGIESAGKRYIAIPADISVEQDVTALVSQATSTWGRLDVLVNVAAVTGSGLADDSDCVSMPLASWDRIISVNLRGTMLVCRAAIPAMLATGGGAIVNVSSRSAAVGNTRFCAYSASKAGVNSLTMHLATAFGKQGIRCNGVMPGFVQGTAAAGHPSITKDYLAAIERRATVPRLGNTSDIAHLVAFLAADDLSGNINGQVINCDGGESVSRG